MEVPVTAARPRPAAATAVFSRYMLPKVAFAMITIASMAGALLTGLRHGMLDVPVLAVRWAGEWALAALLGAAVWHLAYLVPAVRLRPVAGALAYGEAMLILWRRWQVGLLAATVPLVWVSLAWYARLGGRLAAPWVLLAQAALGVAVVAALLGLRAPVSPDRRSPYHTAAALALALVFVALAGLHVRLQGGPWWLVANRSLHLLAFSAWLGGALWNIFIAVPAGMARINLDTAILANLMLERFRVVVRGVFPTIVATGLVQAWAIFGPSWQSVVGSPAGWLLLGKVSLIAGLVAVFILCPLWRACSPIRGVCNLEDLD